MWNTRPPVSSAMRFSAESLVPPKIEAVAVVESAVDIVEAVDDRVRLLRCFDGLLDLVRAALILAVGDQHQHLAAHLPIELIVRRQINRVVQDGPLGMVDGRHRPGLQPADVRVHLQAVEARAKQPRRTGVVLQQLGVGAEADQERQILLAQYLPEESARPRSFSMSIRFSGWR